MTSRMRLLEHPLLALGDVAQEGLVLGEPEHDDAVGDLDRARCLDERTVGRVLRDVRDEDAPAAPQALERLVDPTAWSSPSDACAAGSGGVGGRSSVAGSASQVRRSRWFGGRGAGGAAAAATGPLADRGRWPAAVAGGVATEAMTGGVEIAPMKRSSSSWKRKPPAVERLTSRAAMRRATSARAAGERSGPRLPATESSHDERAQARHDLVGEGRQVAALPLEPVEDGDAVEGSVRRPAPRRRRRPPARRPCPGGRARRRR